MAKDKSKGKAKDKAKDKGKPAKADDPLRIVEKGHFTEARCACGWRGAARRSRKKARQDATDHREQSCKAQRRQ